ncbi:MAG: hypothetical protein AAGD25_16715 [Cyanobacteria bacterium P01_F01_bin.150]
MQNQRFTQFFAAFALAIAFNSCWFGYSDESVLRKEFNIPHNAEVLSYEAYPKESAVMREGLKIEIIFQLSDDDFQNYTAQTATVPDWTPLPIPEDFLRRMASIETRKRWVVERYEKLGEPLPPEGSIYNPTEQQRMKKFVASLPPQPINGVFQIRTAGTDIMNEPKTMYRQPNRDLNDFMLAMVDTDQKQIIIKVSTSY